MRPKRARLCVCHACLSPWEASVSRFGVLPNVMPREETPRFHLPMSLPMMQTMWDFSAAPAHAAPAMPNTDPMVNVVTPPLYRLLLPTLMSEPSWLRGGDASDRQRPLGDLDGGHHDGETSHEVFMCPSCPFIQPQSLLTRPCGHPPRCPAP